MLIGKGDSKTYSDDEQLVSRSTRRSRRQNPLPKNRRRHQNHLPLHHLLLTKNSLAGARCSESVILINVFIKYF